MYYRVLLILLLQFFSGSMNNIGDRNFIQNTAGQSQFLTQTEDN